MKIGKVILGKCPTVCAVLQDSFNQRTLQKIKKAGVRLVELRIDQFKSLDSNYIKQKIKTVKQAGFSVLATIRYPKEGGSFLISEIERFQLFRSIIGFVDAIDIELQSKLCKRVIGLAKRNKKVAIVSFHDFKRTPASNFLEQLFKRAKSIGGSIFKVACSARSQTDYLRLLDFTIQHPNEVITISMGKIGQPSRWVFPQCGSLLTYGSVQKRTAPGQPSVFELLKKL